MRNRALISLSVLALAAVSFAVWWGGGKSTEGEGEDEFRKTQVRAGDFLHTVTATGRVIPDTEVEVTSKAGGEITEMPYDEGDWVKVGQLLARLDPDDELRNVKRSEASLRAAVARKAKAENELELAESAYRKSMTDAEAAIQLTQTKLADAEAKHRRQKGLFATKLIPEELLETSRTTLEQARTERIQALAALEDAKSLSQRIELRKEEITLAEVEVINAQLTLEEVNERLDETEIRAPMAGVITHRPVEPGQVISSAISNVGGGTLLMIISDLSTLFVVAAVDETDIGRIRIDQEAMIKTDAYPDEAFEGRVDRIAPKGVDGGGVVTFNVEIKVHGEGINRLKPGMTADVDIVLEKSIDTKWVESDAIQKGPRGQYVEVMGAEGLTERIPVEVGLSDGIRTEIIGDVNEGQELVIRESDGDSAWQRGEGGKRPLKDNLDNMEIGGRRGRKK